LVSNSDGFFVILGVTGDGRQFRPSDWAERLCGVMSSFRPDAGGAQAHLTYSPYVLPGLANYAGQEVKSVNVHPDLFDLEPMAYQFLVTFAHDNGLKLDGQPLIGPAIRD
jgi:Protein of unknown function (DUF3579)